MPHECTDCGRTFPDGSTEMLSGCPDCDNSTFQYCPPGAVESSEDGPPSTASSSSQSDQSTPATSGTDDIIEATPDPIPEQDGPEDAAQAAARAGVADPTDLERSATPAKPDQTGHPSEADPGEAPAQESAETSQSAKQPAKQSAKAVTTGTEDTTPASTATSEQTEQVDDNTAADSETDDSEPTATPDMEELRAELNDQFESIKILSPGQYELNLMELYDREEYIISLKEDGRYAIEVPDQWAE